MIWRMLRPLLLAVVIAQISANFLVGLPGALFMDALLPAETVLRIGPGVMGLAMYVSMIAPFGIALAIWAMSAWRPEGPLWQWLSAGTAGYVAAGALAAFSI